MPIEEKIWTANGTAVLSDTRVNICCGNYVVGAQYMGQQEMLCCGCPDVEGSENEVIGTFTNEEDARLAAGAPDLLLEVKRAIDREYNPFEPLNQGENFKRMQELVFEITGEKYAP